MEDEKILTLRKAVKLGDDEYTALTLREPTAGELERATRDGRSGMTTTIDLVAMVAGVPRQVIEKVTSRDFREAADYIGGFTDDGPVTG